MCSFKRVNPFIYTQGLGKIDKWIPEQVQNELQNVRFLNVPYKDNYLLRSRALVLMLKFYGLLNCLKFSETNIFCKD